jgi:hypothetical protein
MAKTVIHHLETVDEWINTANESALRADRGPRLRPPVLRQRVPQLQPQQQLHQCLRPAHDGGSVPDERVGAVPRRDSPQAVDPRAVEASRSTRVLAQALAGAAARGAVVGDSPIPLTVGACIGAASLGGGGGRRETMAIASTTASAGGQVAVLVCGDGRRGRPCCASCCARRRGDQLTPAPRAASINSNRSAPRDRQPAACRGGAGWPRRDLRPRPSEGRWGARRQRGVGGGGLGLAALPVGGRGCCVRRKCAAQELWRRCAWSASRRESR